MDSLLKKKKANKTKIKKKTQRIMTYFIKRFKREQYGRRSIKMNKVQTS